MYEILIFGDAEFNFGVRFGKFEMCIKYDPPIGKIEIFFSIINSD